MAERPADDDKSGEPHQPEPRSGDPTVRLPSPPESAERANEKRSPSRGSFTQRFPAGATIAGRYRVISLLGRGGMGEVYRADDLRLDQQVALKFLPRDLGADHEWLERLHNEVRLAREVAHPNVCRVYDVGDEHGDTFLSMEFVDGEDLASLLRRIGRVNPEKAVQIARQLCAGLAAAHERGVLHRDLKPANIMLDGRGAVRIMDFGLALRHEDGSGHIGMAGTPAYMAPEQWAGRDVTKATDIYALGLILFELFTGREAVNAESIDQYRQWHTQGSSHSLSDSLSSINPAVERIILRCLERDPRRRPQSALAVAAALPGGDPLAAALAAGETPSPSMVASAAGSRRTAPALAITLLAATLIGIIAAVLWRNPQQLWNDVGLTKEPAVLAENASSILRAFGYDDTAGSSTAIGFEPNNPYINWRNTNVKFSDDLNLASAPFPALMFYRRTSPSPMAASNPYGRIVWTDPPATVPGMTLIRLDMQGRLIEFLAVPERLDPLSAPFETPSAPATAATEPLFHAAGLDETQFDRTEPILRPSVFADQRSAWIEREPSDPRLPRRIEAAWLDGRPVWFAVIGPWATTSRTSPSPPVATDATSVPPNDQQASETRAATLRTAQRIIGYAMMTLVAAITITMVVLAVRHARAGRGDRRGARVLGLTVMTIALFRWLFLTDVSLSLRFFNNIFAQGVALALLGGALAWLLYMALEPYLRRFWPQSLVTWLRLLDGRFRDPRLGRDVLVGCAGGMILCLMPALQFTIEHSLGITTVISDLEAWATSWLYSFHGLRRVLGLFMLSVQASIVSPMLLLLMILFLRIMLRKAWLAGLAFIAIYTTLHIIGSSAELAGLIVGLIITIVVLVVLMRYGLVAGLGMQLFSNLLTVFPITSDTSAWYFGVGLCGVIAAAALAAYGFWIAITGQSISTWIDESA